MVGRVDVYGSRELQGTILAIRQFDTDVRKQIRAHTRSVATPVYQKALADNLSHNVFPVMRSRVIVNTARITVSDQSVKVTAATQKRAVLSGGLSPARYGAATEFGANQQKTTSYTYRNRWGTRVVVRRRHTARGMPPRRARGTIFWPALNDELIPRLLSLWMQTAIRTMGEALEGGRR